MRILCTCPYGFASILSQEIKRLGYIPVDVFDTGVYVNDIKREDIYCINLRSRIANYVYIEMSCKDEALPHPHKPSTKIETFEDLFSPISKISWNEYIALWTPVKIFAQSSNSTLHSVPTIQSIVHKAIYQQLCKHNNTARREENEEYIPAEISIHIHNDMVRVLLNTSGDALYKRWYRQQTGEAPIKENMAAGMVYMLWWKYNKPLYDIFCGSGTILIEAAMIARNIAPWLQRPFYFQSIPWYDSDFFSSLIQEAKEKIFRSKNYEIIGYDSDATVLVVAQENAQRAGVADTIRFVQKDVLSLQAQDLSWYMITNPPYGKRLTVEDIKKLYSHLINQLVEKNSSLCTEMITSVWLEQFAKKIGTRKKQKTYNGADECVIYRYLP